MNLKTIIRAAVLVAGAAALGAAAQTSPRPASGAGAQTAPRPASGALIKPGLWEITVVHETPGSNTRRSVVSRSCFAAEDVASVERLLPRQREPGMQCENRDLRPAAQGATWQVVCSAKGSSLGGPAKLSFAGGGYVGEAELDLKKAGAKATRVSQRISGKLLGECK